MATEILFDAQWSKSYKDLNGVQRAMAKLEFDFKTVIRYYVQVDFKTQRLIPVIVVSQGQLGFLLGTGHPVVS